MMFNQHKTMFLLLTKMFVDNGLLYELDNLDDLPCLDLVNDDRLKKVFVKL